MRFLKDRRFDPQFVRAGAVVDVPPQYADRFIADGTARLAEPLPEPAKAKRTAKPKPKRTKKK
jgi:hypothetical protein